MCTELIIILIVVLIIFYFFDKKKDNFKDISSCETNFTIPRNMDPSSYKCPPKCPTLDKNRDGTFTCKPRPSSRPIKLDL